MTDRYETAWCLFLEQCDIAKCSGGPEWFIDSCIDSCRDEYRTNTANHFDAFDLLHYSKNLQYHTNIMLSLFSEHSPEFNIMLRYNKNIMDLLRE